VRAGDEEIRLPLAALGGTKLETVWGDDASLVGDEAVLPAGGPAFHAWRIA
jgi:hypothetical protein